jgi:hypothetical protein
MNELLLSQIVSIIAIGCVIFLLIKNKKLKDDLWSLSCRMESALEVKNVLETRLNNASRMLSKSEQTLSRAKEIVLEYRSMVEKYDSLNKELIGSIDEMIKLNSKKNDNRGKSNPVHEHEVPGKEKP